MTTVTMALLLSYRGGHFHGFVRQPGLRTVEDDLRARLRQALGQEPRALRVAGRTDAGVHARGQVVSFRAPATDLDRLVSHLNEREDDLIHVDAAFVMPRSFHARASALGRLYCYRVALTDQALVRPPCHWRVVVPLEIDAMRTAASWLRGRHDFSSFRPRREKRDPVCRLHRLEITVRDQRLIIELEANRFLRRMARCLVGVLLEVGAGQRSPEDMPQILAARDRRAAGLTAPAQGLTLERVYYPSSLLPDACVEGSISQRSDSCSRACTLDRIWAPMDEGEGVTASS